MSPVRRDSKPIQSNMRRSFADEEFDGVVSQQELMSNTGYNSMKYNKSFRDSAFIHDTDEAVQIIQQQYHNLPINSKFRK